MSDNNDKESKDMESSSHIDSEEESTDKSMGHNIQDINTKDMDPSSHIDSEEEVTNKSFLSKSNMIVSDDEESNQNVIAVGKTTSEASSSSDEESSRNEVIPRRRRIINSDDSSDDEANETLKSKDPDNEKLSGDENSSGVSVSSNKKMECDVDSDESTSDKIIHRRRIVNGDDSDDETLKLKDPDNEKSSGIPVSSFFSKKNIERDVDSDDADMLLSNIVKDATKNSLSSKKKVNRFVNYHFIIAKWILI